LRLVNVGELPFTAQSVGHRVGTAQFILHDIVKLDLKILPLACLGVSFFLSLKVTHGKIISLDDALAPEQVMSPCVDTLCHHSHLFVLNCLPPLVVVKLSTFKDNRITLLHQDTTNDKVGSINVQLKRLVKIRN